MSSARLPKWEGGRHWRTQGTYHFEDILFGEQDYRDLGASSVVPQGGVGSGLESSRGAPSVRECGLDRRFVC